MGLYGTNETLEMPGESRGQIKAKAEAETTATAYIMRGAQESSLGLRDRKALRILKINPEGDTNTDPPPGADIAVGQGTMEPTGLF